MCKNYNSESKGNSKKTEMKRKWKNHGEWRTGQW